MNLTPFTLFFTLQSSNRNHNPNPKSKTPDSIRPTDCRLLLRLPIFCTEYTRPHFCVTIDGYPTFSVNTIPEIDLTDHELVFSSPKGREEREGKEWNGKEGNGGVGGLLRRNGDTKGRERGQKRRREGDTDKKSFPRPTRPPSHTQNTNQHRLPTLIGEADNRIGSSQLIPV